MAFIPAIGAAILGASAAAAAGTVGTAIVGTLAIGATGLGIASSVKALSAGGQKIPGAPAAPGLPTVADAAAQAQAASAQRRKISLLSGGQTNLTQGTGGVSPANMGLKTLTGQ